MNTRRMFFLLGAGLAVLASGVLAPEAAHATDESFTLSQVLAKHAHLADPQAKEWSDAVVNALRTELKNGNTVELGSFGRFYVQQRQLKPKATADGSAPGAPRLRRYARFSSAPALKNELNTADGTAPQIGAVKPKPAHS